MAVMTLVWAVASTLLFRSEVGRLALVDQWELAAIAFGQTVDDVRYEELHRLSEYGVSYAVATALLNGPALALTVSGLLFAVFWNGRRHVSFRRVFAVVTHAGVILTLRQVIAAPLAYSRGTTASAMSIGIWFPAFDEASTVARFLGALDLFVVWWTIVLAIGASVLYGGTSRRRAVAFVGAYVGIALAMAVAMATLGGRG